MSGDPKYTTSRRLWIAQPRRKDGWKTSYKVRAISDYDATLPCNLREPDEFVGNGHEPFHLYYHVNEMAALDDQLKVAGEAFNLMKSAYDYLAGIHPHEPEAALLAEKANKMNEEQNK